MILLVLLALLQAPAFEPVYQLRRERSTAAGPYWDNAQATIRLSEWRCDLEPGAPASKSARMPDPGRPGRECEWTAPADSYIFREGANGQYRGTYRYFLAVKVEEFGQWSEALEAGGAPATDPAIGVPGRVRVNPGGPNVDR